MSLGVSMSILLPPYLGLSKIDFIEAIEAMAKVVGQLQKKGRIVRNPLL